MKNDRKIIYCLLGFELVLLSVLVLVADLRAGKIIKSSDEPAFAVSDFFQDSLYLNYYTSRYEDKVPVVSAGYNYYTFSLSKDGIQSQKYAEGLGLSSGLSVSTLSDSEMTIKASSSASSPTIMNYGNLYIQNPYVRTPLSLKEVLSEPLKLKRLSGISDQSVIIYHTHTMEAYCKTEEDRYLVQKAYNETKDNTRNVVTAGEWIRQSLVKNNITTIHDTTIHYEDRVNGVWQDCYYFGIQTLQGLLAEHNKAQLVMDVHRDGVTDPTRDTKRHKSTVKDASGNEYAQIMFVVGLNYNASYQQNDSYNPHWKDNFKLALLLLEKLEERVPGITRGISLRREAYNQHLAQNTLLVEMGFDGNLVSEVTASSKLLGEIIAEVYS